MRTISVLVLVLCVASLEAAKHKKHDWKPGQNRETGKQDGDLKAWKRKEHGHESKVHWKKHRPLAESPDTASKRMWEQMSDYHHSDSDACSQLKCRKREVCLVKEDSKQVECISKRLLRQRQKAKRKEKKHKKAQNKKHLLEEREKKFHQRQTQLKKKAERYEKEQEHSVHKKELKHKHLKQASSNDRKKKRNGYLQLQNTAADKPPKECTRRELSQMGSRLLDWFKLLQDTEDMGHHKEKRNSIKKELRAEGECICQAPVSWEFQQLDTDYDGQLSIQELAEIESNGYEHCVTPFIEACDHDKDAKLSDREWCCCFSDVLPPCESDKRKSPAVEEVEGREMMVLGAFVPQCDSDGFYKKIQCHASVGYCWCVDRNGHEMKNTKTRGTPQCDNLPQHRHKKRRQQLDNDV